MDLKTFAALSNQVYRPQDKSKNDLMPKQQSTRAYKSHEKEKPTIELEMMKHRFGEMRNKWIMKYTPRTPVGLNRRDITPKQVKDFAYDWMMRRSDEGDDEYIKIEKANLGSIEYSFDVEKWYKDNFLHTIPRYVAPISLHFRYRRDFPRFIYVNAPFHEFVRFLKKSFKEFLDKNKRKLYHRKFRFLKKVTPDIFEYNINFQMQHFIVSLKYSVILGSLAAYMMFFHNKKIDSNDEKGIKKDLSKYSSVKKLDRYVKRL